MITAFQGCFCIFICWQWLHLNEVLHLIICSTSQGSLPWSTSRGICTFQLMICKSLTSRDLLWEWGLSWAKGRMQVQWSQPTGDLWCGRATWRTRISLCFGSACAPLAVSSCMLGSSWNELACMAGCSKSVLILALNLGYLSYYVMCSSNERWTYGSI